MTKTEDPLVVRVHTWKLFYDTTLGYALKYMVWGTRSCVWHPAQMIRRWCWLSPCSLVCPRPSLAGFSTCIVQGNPHSGGFGWHLSPASCRAWSQRTLLPSQYCHLVVIIHSSYGLSSTAWQSPHQLGLCSSRWWSMDSSL